MSNNNEYRKIKNCWGWEPEIQRAAEKEFYGKPDDNMRHKKKSKKKGKPRGDHKHIYVEAVIIRKKPSIVTKVEDLTEIKSSMYNGKVCKICGLLHSKNWRRSFQISMGNIELKTEGLPIYQSLGNGTAILVKE